MRSNKAVGIGKTSNQALDDLMEDRDRGPKAQGHTVCAGRNRKIKNLPTIHQSQFISRFSDRP